MKVLVIIEPQAEYYMVEGYKGDDSYGLSPFT